MEIDQERAAKIAELNDNFRRTLQGGKLLLTASVQASPFTGRICELVREFNDFSEDNDPYGEHDFGAVEYRGVGYFFKIDYYDLEYKYLSREPANEIVTNRVLTIMRADEY